MSTPPLSTPLVPDHAAPLTKQQLFDIAWRWSRTHPQCRDTMGTCAYRSPAMDNACLIGAAIPDSIYDRAAMEHNAASVLRHNHSRCRTLFADEATGVWLDALQRCHDNPFSIEEEVTPYLEVITRRLTVFAADHGLTIPTEN